MTEIKKRVTAFGLLALCIAALIVDLRLTEMVALGGAWCCVVWLWNDRCSEFCARRKWWQWVLVVFGFVVWQIGLVFLVCFTAVRLFKWLASDDARKERLKRAGQTFLVVLSIVLTILMLTLSFMYSDGKSKEQRSIERQIKNLNTSIQQSSSQSMPRLVEPISK
jgi:energy-coupling factor transporter transmembrane protein EcfT